MLGASLFHSVGAAIDNDCHSMVFEDLMTEYSSDVDVPDLSNTMWLALKSSECKY